MARYIICPRCELNFIDADEQEYCEVCIKEMSGEKTFADDFDAEESMEETELCPVCGENYMVLGEKMCEECKKKAQYEEHPRNEQTIIRNGNEEFRLFLLIHIHTFTRHECPAEFLFDAYL